VKYQGILDLSHSVLVIMDSYGTTLAPCISGYYRLTTTEWCLVMRGVLMNLRAALTVWGTQMVHGDLKPTNGLSAQDFISADPSSPIGSRFQRSARRN